MLTYNDLAPPAAVQRKATPQPAEARVVVKAKRRGVSPLLLLGIAAFLGVSFGLACAVVLIGVIVVVRVI